MQTKIFFGSYGIPRWQQWEAGLATSKDVDGNQQWLLPELHAAFDDLDFFFFVIALDYFLPGLAQAPDFTFWIPWSRPLMISQRQTVLSCLSSQFVSFVCLSALVCVFLL